MTHHTNDHPEAEGHDHPHPRGEGEGEGFFDKVKEFFTGPADDRSSADSADAPITDSVADSTESVDSTDSGWDGSDEPPELAVPGNEAVAAFSDASPDDSFLDTGMGDADYESRHGNGVDDSGVLADAPQDGPEDGAAGEPDGDETMENPDWADPDPDESSPTDAPGDSTVDDELGGDSAGEAADAGEEEDRARREEEFAREHDPSTHDVAAGEEFRQPGDWTADEHGGPQVQEPDGTVHDPGEGSSGASWGGESGGPGESGPDDVRDGGHGWGSAAPIEGGAMPLGHPVKAWHDTMTFVLPGEDGYEGSDAHEWFVDGQAAQNAGFRHAHGG